MGKCLSCCGTPDQPLQNGCATTTKASYTTQSMSLGLLSNSSDCKSASVSLGCGAGEPLMRGHYHQTNTSNKMFGQYPKLPPIRRSSVDHKRVSKEFSESRIQTMFEHYKDTDEDAILAEGIEVLCEDLNVRPEELKVLILAWNMRAETMCKLTCQEFMSGCRKLRVDSVRGLQARFPDMLREMQNKQTFKELYRWTYKFGLDTEGGQKTLPIDMAISLWKLVFSICEPPIVDRWLSFLQAHPNIRGIPRDTWDMFLNFTESVGDDLSNYDDTEAWPSLFDDFVEYENDRENQNVQPDKVKMGYD